MPSTASIAAFAVLIPITSPFAFSRAPPLFPGLIAASVWIRLLSIPSIVLSVAEIIPLVTDCPYPSAFPMAIASSPTWICSESPSVATAIFSLVLSFTLLSSTATTARSRFASVPFIFASTLSWSMKDTVSVSLPSTT